MSCPPTRCSSGKRSRSCSRSIKDAETGQRGFLLTGEEKYLEPYQAAIRLVPAHATRLRELTADNAAQQGQLVRLDGLIGAKLSELATTIQIRREAGLEAASRIVRSDVGIRVMGDIRALLAAMREEESRLYAAREIRLDEAAHTATAVNIAALVVAFALVIGATVLTMRALRHRPASRPCGRRPRPSPWPARSPRHGCGPRWRASATR